MTSRRRSQAHGRVGNLEAGVVGGARRAKRGGKGREQDERGQDSFFHLKILQKFPAGLIARRINQGQQKDIPDMTVATGEPARSPAWREAGRLWCSDAAAMSQSAKTCPFAAAISEYQRDHALVPDGNIGPRTCATLLDQRSRHVAEIPLRASNAVAA